MGVELAQRYLDSAFCTWRSTGGAIPNVLPDLPNSPPNATGTIFEKYADNSTNEAGGGGEYVVVPGFGVESIVERTNSSGVMAFFFGLAICSVTNWKPQSAVLLKLLTSQMRLNAVGVWMITNVKISLGKLIRDYNYN